MSTARLPTTKRPSPTALLPANPAIYDGVAPAGPLPQPSATVAGPGIRMNSDSCILSEFDPLKAAIFGPFTTLRAIRTVSLAIFVRERSLGIFGGSPGLVCIDLARRGLAERACPAGCCGSDKRCIERQMPDST